MTVDVQGWVWTDEGRRKWGWVANSTGATLDIKVPAVVPHESMRNMDGNATLVGRGEGVEAGGGGSVEGAEGARCC